ncbi:MAG TPA: DNA polymerase III subunit delta [Candidatus Saccharimonadales bacterium]|nr:DNA polymerase III subunit delta [Candidatus Saccharimonadales bacterium]
MIVTLAGENSFALRRRLNGLVESFVKKHGELALERIDAEEAEIASVNEAILALPFLSTHKMVVVRNGSANKAFTEQVEQIISSVSDSTDLILHEPSLDKRTVYFKVLKNKTSFEEFNQLDKNTLAKWLVDEAKKQDAKLAFSDAVYLVERVGDNQEMLYNELTKLAIYNSEISKANIDLLTEPTPQSKVFDLLDAAFGGQKSRALELYADQRAQKVEPQAILAMIAWQLQLLTLIKFAGSKPTGQIAKDAGMNPYPVNKAAGLARRLDEDKLREMVDEALKIDLKSKTTSLDLDEALKTYITTL